MAIEVGTPVIAEGLPVTFRDQSVWLDPNTFPNSYMFSIDFDETCYTTFISSGVGVEVHEAYENSVEQVLGPDARQDFSAYGGLSNRAPLDVIEGLIQREPELINHALDHAKKFFAHPDDISNIGLGIVARFADRGMSVKDELTTRAITEMLVVRKKQQLMPQIGPDWPQPVAGFEDAWRELNDLKRGKGRNVNYLELGAQAQHAAAVEKWKRVHFAIVSSGHTDFISKVLNTAYLPHPDVYMTDDEMRQQKQPRTKPDPLALNLVRNAWLNAYLVSPGKRAQPDFLAATKRHQAYVGDDPEKDGEMARNDGVQFILHDGKPQDWPGIKELIIETVEGGKELSGAA